MKNKVPVSVLAGILASTFTVFVSCGNTLLPFANDSAETVSVTHVNAGEAQTVSDADSGAVLESENVEMAYFTLIFGDKLISAERKVNPDYNLELDFDDFDYQLWAGKFVDGEAQTQTLVTNFSSNMGSLPVGTYSFTLKAGIASGDDFTTQYIATIEEQELVPGDVTQNPLYFFFSPAGETGTLKYSVTYPDYSSAYNITASAKYVKYAERSSGTFTSVTPKTPVLKEGIYTAEFETSLTPGLYKFYFLLTNTVTDETGKITASKDTVWSEIVKIEAGYPSPGAHNFENINIVIPKPTDISAFFTLNTIEVTDLYQLNVTATTPSEGGWLTFDCYASEAQITDLDTNLKQTFIQKDIEFEGGEQLDGIDNQYSWTNEATSTVGTYYFYVAVKNHFTNPFTGKEMISEPAYFAVANPLVVIEEQAHFGLSLNPQSNTVPEVVEITLEAQPINKTTFVVVRPSFNWLNGEQTITGTSWEFGDGTVSVDGLVADITDDQLTKLGIEKGEYDIVVDTTKMRAEGIGLSDEFTVTFNVDLEIDGEPDSFDARFTGILNELSGSGGSSIDQFSFWQEPQETELWILLEEDSTFAASVEHYLLYVVDSEDETKKILDGVVVTDNKYILSYDSLESGHTYLFTIRAYADDGAEIIGRANEWTYVLLSFDVNVEEEQLVIFPEPGSGLVNLDHYTYSFFDVDEAKESVTGSDEAGICRIALAELTESHNYIITLRALDSDGNIIAEATNNWTYGPGGYNFPYDISFSATPDTATQMLVITPIVENEEFDSKFYVYDIIIEDKVAGTNIHYVRYTWSTDKSVSIEFSKFETGKTYLIKLPAWDSSPNELAYAEQEYVHNQ